MILTLVLALITLFLLLLINEIVTSKKHNLDVFAHWNMHKYEVTFAGQKVCKTKLQRLSFNGKWVNIDDFDQLKKKPEGRPTLRFEIINNDSALLSAVILGDKK